MEWGGKREGEERRKKKKRKEKPKKATHFATRVTNKGKSPTIISPRRKSILIMGTWLCGLVLEDSVVAFWGGKKSSDLEGKNNDSWRQLERKE